MSEKTLLNLIRAVCGVLVALPGTLAMAPGLALTPGENAALLVLALLGATVLSQLSPASLPRRASLRDRAEELERLYPNGPSPKREP